MTSVGVADITAVSRMAKTRKEIWSDAEFEAWKLPEDLSVSQWADRHRILAPMTSAEPGQWKTDRTPYLRGIMDAFNDPFVEEITIMASTQVGKTESLHNMIAYAIDQDPGPVLVVMPRDEDAKSLSSKRIIPMIEHSPRLKMHFTKDQDDVTKKEIQLARMVINFTGANSPAGLATRPVRFLFFDETDKYPHFSGKESDPISLATERTRTFWNRKIVKCSTPTTREGYIFREYEKSDQCKFYVPCPHCGEYQILLFRPQLRWTEEVRDPDKIRNNNLAWYECVTCKGRITDTQKRKMLLSGQWVPEGCSIDKAGAVTGNIPENPRRRGFWLNALYSPWLSFSDIAAKFLESEKYLELLQNFVNSWLAEVWEEKIEKTEPEELRSLAGPVRKGIVPTRGIVLTAGVDVQKDHFYLVIRAWGPRQESWLILEERVESWEDVVKILFSTQYPAENSNLTPFQVRLACIDSGYRTDEVYEICRKWKHVAKATKGHDRLGGQTFKPSLIDRTPSGDPIPGGLTLYHVDTTYLKDKITRLVKNTQEGIWHLHADPSMDYLRQFCAEHKILIRDKKTGKSREEWRPVSPHAASHYLDAEVYAMVAGEMLRVYNLQEGDRPIVHRPDQQAAPRLRVEYGKGNWINRGREGSWLKK